MMAMMEHFKAVLIVMLFYSVCITTVSHALPSGMLNYVDLFSSGSTVDLQSTATAVQGSIQEQTRVPLVELGAMIFYSGNIVLDLLLNFAFAIPQMVGMLLNGILLLFNIHSDLFIGVQLFASVILIVFYFIGLIELLLSLRSSMKVV